MKEVNTQRQKQDKGSKYKITKAMNKPKSKAVERKKDYLKSFENPEVCHHSKWKIEKLKKQQSVLNTIRAVALANEKSQQKQVQDEVVKVLKAVRKSIERKVKMYPAMMQGLATVECLDIIDKRIVKESKEN
jgi:hypothetical protein